MYLITIFQPFPSQLLGLGNCLVYSKQSGAAGKGLATKIPTDSLCHRDLLGQFW